MPRVFDTGGMPLHCTVWPAGNKNAALPMMAAALMVEGTTTLHNVLRIRDAASLLELIEDLGASASWTGTNTLVIDAKKLTPKQLSAELCSRIRASILWPGRRSHGSGESCSPARWRCYWTPPSRYPFPGLRAAGCRRHHGR